jgi:hypothetical protein
MTLMLLLALVVPEVGENNEKSTELKQTDTTIDIVHQKWIASIVIQWR